MGELADRYAQAFLEAGGDGAELARCARQLEEEPVLWEALCSPAVTPEEKGRVLARLPEVAPPGPAGRLLTLMAEKERLPLLPQVVQAARRLALERESIRLEKGNFSSWWENKSRRDQFEQSENEKLKKEIGRLRETSAQACRWADRAEAVKIGYDPRKEKTILGTRA